MRQNTQRLSKVYDGSSKTLYATNQEMVLIQFFKDEIFWDQKIHVIPGKGIINNQMSAMLMKMMDLVRIDHHLIEKVNMREQRVQMLEMLPVQVCVSNIAIGRYVTSYGMQEGYLFESPMMDFRIRNKKANYPSMNEQQLAAFNLMFPDEIDDLKALALRVNDFLVAAFAAVRLRLVEVTLEFGRVFDGDTFLLMLADELTIETCVLWDMDTNQKFDLEAIITRGNISIYQEVLDRFRFHQQDITEPRII